MVKMVVMKLARAIDIDSPQVFARWSTEAAAEGIRSAPDCQFKSLPRLCAHSESFGRGVLAILDFPICA